MAQTTKYQVSHMETVAFFEDKNLVPIGIENLTKD